MLWWWNKAIYKNESKHSEMGPVRQTYQTLCSAATGQSAPDTRQIKHCKLTKIRRNNKPQSDDNVQTWGCVNTCNIGICGIHQQVVYNNAPRLLTAETQRRALWQTVCKSQRKFSKLRNDSRTSSGMTRVELFTKSTKYLHVQIRKEYKRTGPGAHSPHVWNPCLMYATTATLTWQTQHAASVVDSSTRPVHSQSSENNVASVAGTTTSLLNCCNNNSIRTVQHSQVATDSSNSKNNCSEQTQTVK